MGAEAVAWAPAPALVAGPVAAAMVVWAVAVVARAELEPSLVADTSSHQHGSPLT